MTETSAIGTAAADGGTTATDDVVLQVVHRSMMTGKIAK